MQETLEMINLDSIDKTDWESFPFEKIAHRISETVDPNTTELEVYVGLEHIDAEDIHIRRFGSPNDVKGGKLKCYPGDVIFGKRRAYQRKAAIAEFEGICSAHAFVFRANSDIIDPNLFPFFLHSDQFMHRMVDISVGGLSPTINWGNLKGEEFLLPPKAEQARLAELLWAMDEVVEKEKRVLEKGETKIKALQKKLYNKKNNLFFKLDNYANILGGFAFPSKSFINKGVPVIKIKNIVQGKIIVNEDSNYISTDNVERFSKYSLLPGDILIAMTGATLGKIGVVTKEYDGALLNQRVGKFQVQEGIDLNFMRGILDSCFFLYELNKYVGEGAQGNISSEDISKTNVPKLEKHEMIKIGEIFKSLYDSIFFMKMKINSSQSLQKSLINQIF